MKDQSDMFQEEIAPSKVRNSVNAAKGVFRNVRDQVVTQSTRISESEEAREIGEATKETVKESIKSPLMKHVVGGVIAGLIVGLLLPVPMFTAAGVGAAIGAYKGLTS